MLHATLQPPSSNSRHVTFSQYNVPTANHIGDDFSPKPLAFPQPRLPPLSTSDFLQNDGCLGHLPMIIHTPEQRGFQWIVTTGPLSWPLGHMQKPLQPPLNQIHQLETLTRRQRRL